MLIAFSCTFLNRDGGIVDGSEGVSGGGAGVGDGSGAGSGSGVGARDGDVDGVVGGTRGWKKGQAANHEDNRTKVCGPCGRKITLKEVRQSTYIREEYFSYQKIPKSEF